MRWILKLTAFFALLCFYISVIDLTVLPVSAQELRWEQMNVPYGGTINALIATPDGTLYAGVDNVGVFRSENGGNSWIKTKLTHPRVTSLTIKSGILYAGSVGIGGIEVFRSEDEGNNWIKTGFITDPWVEKSSLTVMGISLFAGVSSLSGGGIYRSDDSGNSWVKMELSPGRVNSLAIIDTTIFAGTGWGGYKVEYFVLRIGAIPGHRSAKA